jgi:pimeloyl-ACP methyl ester carboxylesterase
MEAVTSRDGTPIAYERTGEGPPLVMVHGMTSTHRSWELLPKLREHFTAYAMERRGRGESGDDAEYSLEREVEDVLALVDSTGGDGPVDLLGHSHGAILVLEAALRRAGRVRRLVLYEGSLPFPEGTELYRPEALDAVRSRLEAGDKEGALLAFYREIAMLAPEDIEMVRSLPQYPTLVAMAPTIPRELQAEEGYYAEFDPARLGDFGVPTLVLVGGESPAFEKAAAEALVAALPAGRLVVLPGQGHLAHRTAPELLEREVLQFLLEEGQRPIGASRPEGQQKRAHSPDTPSLS